MIIQRMRCYFLYSVPVINHLLTSDDEFTIGMNQPLIERLKQRFQVQPAEIPAFYTRHYRTEHTPYLILDPQLSPVTYLSKEKLAHLDFFAGLELAQDVPVRWDFILPLQGIGLITLCLEVEGPLPSDRAYRLSGLYLNPDYAVIATGPIQSLWSQSPGDLPEFVTPDELARAIHTHFFRRCGLDIHRYRALRHEVQIPLTAVEVTTEHNTQRAFLEKEAKALAELVFRPACWEVEQASLDHTRYILAENRVWSVAKDSLFIAAYEGSLYVKIKNLEIGAAQEVSGFKLADEHSILHSYKVAVSNYHFLRILDDLLDQEMHRLVQMVNQYRCALRESLKNEQALAQIDQFVIHVSTLRFQLVDLLEEIGNSNKLMDEEWHIVLLDKLNAALGIKVWYDTINRRVENLRELTQTIENTYEKLTDLSIGRHIEQLNTQMFQMNLQSQKVESRLKRAQPFFEALAAVEALTLLINIWFESQYPLVVTVSHWFRVQVGLTGKILSTAAVLLALFFIIQIIRWVANRGQDEPSRPIWP